MSASIIRSHRERTGGRAVVWTEEPVFGDEGRQRLEAPGGERTMRTVRIALHTRVRADRVAEYLPVNIAWQARMAELLDVAHDYSAGGAGAGLPVVWQL
jgi:hypothetical protein